jgi:hypothetical protein
MRLALVMVIITAAFTSRAQVSGPTCIPHPTVTNAQYTYTLGAGQTYSSWGTKGDLTVVSSSVSGTTYTANVQSTGFGRGQVIFYYTSGGCSPVPVPLSVNKTFSQSNATLLGPSCVVAGGAYGYIASPPLVSTAAQISNNIGIDSYTWDLPTGATAVYSGDHSAAVVTMPATFTTNRYVRVTIGACNNAVTEYLEIPLSTQPLKPLLSLASGAATCKDNLSAFTFSYNVQIGVNYTWSLPNGWTISLPNTVSGTVSGLSGTTVSYSSAVAQTATITPSTATFGDVSVTAAYPTGGCLASPSDVFHVTRQLTTATNITASPSGCLTPGSSVTFSFTNPFPANTAFQWTLPTGSGWAITTNNGNSIVATVGTGPGDVFAQVAGCNTGGSNTLHVDVTSNNGCSYKINDNGCGVYQAVRSAPLPVTNACLAEQYYFTITGPGPSFTPIASSPANTTSPLNNTANFYSPPSNVSVPAGSIVTVVATKASTCLRVVKTLTTADDYIPGVTCRGVNNPSDGGATSSPIGEQTVVYPNPAGSFLQVDLPVKKAGPSQLTLTDALGRVVLSTRTEEIRTKLDVRHVPAGIYTLRTTVPGGKEQAQTVVVQH